jgi:sigma-B regulation protein RsbU (phosphoserine phosphatase)
MSKIPKNADLLQQLLDHIDDNIFFKDRDSKFIMINRANANWFGLTDPQEIVGKDDFDFFEKEHAQKQLEEERWIMETGKSVLGEVQSESQDDNVHWGSVTKMPLRDQDGEIIGTMGIARDISELKIKEQELKQAHEQIVDDLRLAAKLQQAFLPHNYPAFVDADNAPLIQFHHFYEADIDLGGDFCSVYQLSDSRAGLLICDVMGHGVRAALVTAILHAFAQELVQKTDSPGNFLTALNKRLVPLLQSEEEFLFATATYCTVDLETGEMALAHAGHTLPFLIQPQLGKVSQLTPAENTLGPALAIVADYSYETTHVQLLPGDEVLMYTDGICEALNTSRDEFGVEHLQETIQNFNTLPLEELIPAIINVVQDYAGSKKLGDDICLLGFTLNALRKASTERNL